MTADELNDIQVILDDHRVLKNKLIEVRESLLKEVNRNSLTLINKECLNIIFDIETLLMNRKKILQDRSSTARMIIDHINFLSFEEDDKNALQYLFSSLFSLLNKKDYHTISLIFHEILNSNTHKLKMIYLIGMISITYYYKSNIYDYMIFYNFVKDQAQAEMTEEEFKLTFQDFD